MVIDIISVILSFIGVVQNAGSSRRKAVIIKHVKDALNYCDQLLQLLRDAKTIHDGFESLLLSLGYDASALVHTEINPNSIAEILTRLKFFDQVNKRFVLSSFKANEIKPVEDGIQVSAIPGEIRQNVRLAIEYYHLMITSFSKYTYYRDKISERIDSGSINSEMKTDLLQFDHHLKDGCLYADKVILNISAVIDYMFSILRSSLGGK